MAVCRQDMLYKDYTSNPIPTKTETQSVHDAVEEELVDTLILDIKLMLDHLESVSQAP